MPSLDLDGGRLSYRDSGGEGTPVLLVHGFPFTSELWDPQFTALGKKFRLIAPDLRGYGRSTSTTDPSSYSMRLFADDLRALLAHLEVERVVLGGLSMGGYIAFEFLRLAPSSVHALVLADTRPDPDSSEVRARREAQQEQVAAAGGGSLVDPMTQALLSDETRRERPQVVAALEALMAQEDAAWIGGLEAMKGRIDSTPDLGGISVPTLILVGEHDSLAPPEVARGMSERITGSRLVVIEGAGHVSNLEAPEAFNAALESFLDEL